MTEGDTTPKSSAKRRRLSASSTLRRPFKSPFKAIGGPPTPISATKQRNSKTIKLSEELNLLKQAIKIRNDGSEAKLNELIIKWKTAARSTAETLFSHSQANPSSTYTFAKEDISDSWGWATDKAKTQDDEGDYCSSFKKKEDQPVPEIKEQTMAVMLANYGIPTEILGWDEKEEDWVD